MFRAPSLQANSLEEEGGVEQAHQIYKRDAPFRAVFKVKALAVIFPPYPREMKTNTAKFKSAAILSLAFFYGDGQPVPTRALSCTRGLSIRTHLAAVVVTDGFKSDPSESTNKINLKSPYDNRSL